MTNLTEQWKKGELPEGEYWCLSICDDIDKLYCYQNSFWKYKTEDDYYGVPVEIKQVLAPVPSYEEYQKLKESREELNSDIADKAYENAMLKSEYEKECKRADELEDSYWKEVEKNKKLKKYEQIVTSYNMKPIDYEIACETVNKLLDEKKALKEENTKLKELLKQSRIYVKIDTEDYDDRTVSKTDKDEAKKLLTKIDEALQ